MANTYLYVSPIKIILQESNRNGSTIYRDIYVCFRDDVLRHYTYYKLKKGQVLMV